MTRSRMFASSVALLGVTSALVVGCTSEAKDWERAKANHQPSLYCEFVKSYPNSPHGVEARQRSAAAVASQLDESFVLLSKNELEKAKPMLEGILECPTRSALALNNLACVYAASGKLSKAKRLLNEAASVASDDEVGRLVVFRVFASGGGSGSAVVAAFMRPDGRTAGVDVVQIDEQGMFFPVGSVATVEYENWVALGATAKPSGHSQNAAIRANILRIQ